jgi:hypothetical protein
MDRRVAIIVALLVLGSCSAEQAPEPSADATVAAPSEPPATSGWDPASILAPSWIDPPTPTRTREPAGEQTSREWLLLYEDLIAVERCALLDGWFAPCLEAERLLVTLEPAGNGSPGPSVRHSQLGATHVDDPAAPVRLAASFLLANHSATVENQVAGPPNWARLIEALEAESDADVLALQLRSLALAEGLEPRLAERVATVGQRALGHESLAVRKAAIEALTHPDVRRRPGLLEALLRSAALDPDDWVRARACARLGVFAYGGVEAWLLEQSVKIEHVIAAACLEGALELAVRGPVASSATGAALLERVAAAGPDLTHARMLRLLARAATREGGEATFDRQALVAAFANELGDASNDLRVREAAAFAAMTIGAGQELRWALVAQKNTSLDPFAEHLLARCELLGSFKPASDEGLHIATTELGRSTPALVGWADPGTWMRSEHEDAGAQWDAAADAHFVLLTPRSGIDDQPINLDYLHVRTLLFPPSLITLVGNVPAPGTKLPDIRFPALEDDQAWASLGDTIGAFNQLAEGAAINWGFMSEAKSTTPTGLAQRENLIELAAHYQALRAAAAQGREAVINTGVERILASDIGFFGDRRPAVALVATTRQSFGWCWHDWTQPCEKLSVPQLPETISRRILAGRLEQGDVGIRIYDIARRNVRAELVDLLRELAPRSAGGHTRIWVELTGTFVHAQRRANPTLWLEPLLSELELAGVDVQRIRPFVHLPQREHVPASVSERLDQLSVWYR